MASCAICCDLFTECVRKPVGCNSCDIKVCLKCTKKYLLDTLQDAHCMGCRTMWSRQFLDENIGTSFLNRTYRKRREDVLFGREKAMMPGTMPYVEEYLAYRKLTKIYTMIEELENNRIMLESDQNVAPEELQRIDTEIIELEQQVVLLRPKLEISEQKARKAMVRACPADGCLGFLGEDWECGICEVQVCKECHEIKGDLEHTCLAENIATAKLLSQDTQSCPKCASMIFKIDGCDQMWCTQCKTAFSWKTGEIETGRLHNPHYYEYVREHGGVLPRADGDAPCGGRPTVIDLRNLLIKKIKLETFIRVCGTIRLIDHVEGAEMLLCRPQNPEEYEELNRRIRIQYLAKEMSEVKFKSEIQQHEKSRGRLNEIYAVWQMFVLAGTDISQRFYKELKDKSQEKKMSPKEYKYAIRAYIKEFKTLVSYANECQKKIANLYGRKSFRTISDDFWIEGARGGYF